jgi:hypothetical protein
MTLAAAIIPDLLAATGDAEIFALARVLRLRHLLHVALQVAYLATAAIAATVLTALRKQVRSHTGKDQNGGDGFHG